MEYIAVIADDLTGACDTGVKFSKYGMQVMVIVDYKFLDKVNHDKEVWAINTDTRSLSAKDAYIRVLGITQKLASQGINQIYKKIDSTLRGHAGAELEAILDALQADLAIVVPAFPANGRIVRSGDLLVNGERLCGVQDVLQREMHRQIGNLGLESFVGGVGSLAQAIINLQEVGRQVIVIDAEKEEDLELIAATLSLLPGKTVVAGAAGLAAYLPPIWGLKSEPPLWKSYPGVTMLVAGSSNPVTTAQIREVQAYKNAPLLAISLQEILQGATAAEMDRLSARAEKYLRAGDNSLLILSVSSPVATKENNTNYRLDKRRLGEEIATALGEITRRLVLSSGIEILMITGGDTAVHVCRALQAWGIDLIAEPLPGIPLGKLIGGVAHGLTVVTKAGGFGSNDAFDWVVDKLQAIEGTTKILKKEGECSG